MIGDSSGDGLRSRNSHRVMVEDLSDNKVPYMYFYLEASHGPLPPCCFSTDDAWLAPGPAAEHMSQSAERPSCPPQPLRMTPGYNNNNYADTHSTLRLTLSILMLL